MDIRTDSLFHNYCEILNNLMSEIKSSTKTSTETISKKKFRSNNFDQYVLAIDGLNSILQHITLLIKEVIISLVEITIDKNDKSIIHLFNSIHLLMDFIISNNIFLRIQEYIALIEDKKRDTHEFIFRVKAIKITMIKIFTTTLDITMLFLPNLRILKESIKDLDHLIDQQLDDEKIIELFEVERIESILHLILNIQLRSEIILKLDVKFLKKELETIKTADFAKKMDDLQAQNSELYYIVNELNYKISVYMNKNRSFPFKYKNILFGRSI